MRKIIVQFLYILILFLNKSRIVTEEFLGQPSLLGVFLPAYTITVEQIDILLNTFKALAAENTTSTLTSVNIRRLTE